MYYQHHNNNYKYYGAKCKRTRITALGDQNSIGYFLTRFRHLSLKYNNITLILYYIIMDSLKMCLTAINNSR